MRAFPEEVHTVICKYCGSDNCIDISTDNLYVCRECGKMFEVEDERDQMLFEEISKDEE